MLVNSDKDNNENNDEEEFVNFYSISDERMKELGQILKTPKSRRIYQLLIKKELHAKEIGIIIDCDENPRLPNLTHHLKKMARIGLLKTKIKNKNGHQVMYYKAVKYLMIVPEEDFEIASKSKTLKTTFRKVFKIATIGLVTMGSYFLTKPETIIYDGAGNFLVNPVNVEVIIPFIVLGTAIGIERIITYYFKTRSIFIK